jgi:hypothetical protein
VLKKSEALQSLLLIMREHPGFPDLLKAVETPKIPRFKRSQAADAEKARAEWIFASGKIAQHEMWLALLTNNQIPPEAE